MLFVDAQMIHREKKGVVLVGQIGVASADFGGRSWELDTPQRGTDRVQA